ALGVPARLRLIMLAVDIPADHPRLPLQRENVEFLVESLPLRRGEGLTAVHVLGPGASIMQRAEDLVWLLAQIFHDVDFAARCPAAIDTVRRHHPDRRPDPLPDRHLCADLDPRIL